MQIVFSNVLKFNPYLRQQFSILVLMSCPQIRQMLTKYYKNAHVTAC